MRFCPARPELPIRPLVNAVVPSTSDVARPGVQVRGQRGERGLGVARHQQAEIRDVAGFARGQAGGEGVGRRHRLARRRGVAAFQQRVRAGGMGEGKAGSAAMARSNASIAPGYMVSFASQPWT